MSMEHCLFATLDQNKKTQLNEIFYATVQDDISIEDKN